MQKPSYVQFANTLRGIAALSVVISHFYGVYWFRPDAVAALIKSNPLPSEGAPIYVRIINAASPPIEWGSFGVSLFFLISGFVIADSLSKTAAIPFMIGRFFRIVPTYVVGFGFTLAAIWFNVRATGAVWPPFPYSHIAIHLIPGFRDLLGTTNIDGIIWTLEIEVKFYLVCALAAPLFRRRSPLVFLIPLAISALFVLVALIWHPDQTSFIGRLMFAGQFIVFMFAGSAFYFAYTGALTERQGILIAALIVLTFVVLWAVGPIKEILHLSWNYGGALIVFWLAFTFPRFFGKSSVTEFLAKISYPLYVVHAIVGYSLLAVLRSAGLRASVCLAITTVFVIALAYLIHIAIEMPSRRLSKSFGLSLAASR